MIGQAVCSMASRVAKLWAPPAKTSVSEWADRYRYLSPESAAEPGKWTSFTYQREPMDACSDSAVREVVIKSATQMIKTSTIENFAAWAIDVDPGPLMIVQPRDEDADDFAAERLDPMIRDTPRLAAKITESRLKAKKFTGGRLSVVSAGSPANMARRALRYLLCDEVDLYRVTAAGTVVTLGKKRLATFRHRAKVLLVCSPTIEGSEIDRAYAASDQREFHVVCPFCTRAQSLMRKWHRVRWDESLATLEQQARSARYHCEVCDQPWDDAARLTAVEQGHWVAGADFSGVAGFAINELYSMHRHLWQIVLDFLKAKNSPDELKAFTNTSLAENWADQGTAPEWENLLLQREEYPVGVVPRGALVLTAGADVHADRIEVEVVAWGRNRESWSVQYEIYYGPTADLISRAHRDEPNPWEKLEALLGEYFPVHGGGDLLISRMFVDSGYQTNTVYEWVRRQPASRVTAIKGVDRGHLPVGQPSAVDLTYGGRKMKSGIRIRLVNGPFFKEELYADLRKRRPTEEERARGQAMPAGYCHFPRGKNYGDEHFRQLCAEQVVSTRDRKTGRTRREWQQIRPNNHALDCRIYSAAARWDLGIDRYQERNWKLLEDQLLGQEAFELVVASGPPPAAALPVRRAVIPAFVPRRAPAVQVNDPYLA